MLARRPTDKGTRRLTLKKSERFLEDGMVVHSS